jgi:cysteine-rich repeat protein
MDFGTCVCNNNLNYFLNNFTTTCDVCNITNCSICATLYDCAICTLGSYLNTSTLECLPEVCGNGLLEGIEQCDDLNTADGDGCSSFCQIEPFYLCSGLPSVCFLDNRFNMEVADINYACNRITYAFRIFPFNSAYTPCDYSNLLISQN